MRIYSKRIHVLGLTPNEISQLLDMVTEAKAGHTVNYSERQQPDGSFFGISIDPKNEHVAREQVKPSNGEPYRNLAKKA